MYLFTLGALILWPGLVFYLFGRMPYRQAIVTAFVGAWLFLPPVAIRLPGIPDWTKTTATVVTVVLVLLIQRPAALLAFRPRWFDLPVLGFSVCSFASSLSTGIGAYEGLSSVLEESLRWVVPYMIGRLYLADAGGARQLATGIAVGGMLYMPFCLLEMRISPILKTYVYGIYELNSAEFGYRYGGYRPAVFLASGLEVGWWMCCATLCAYLLIASRATRRWFNLPAVPLAWFLAFVTLACKSTGALTQVTVGFLLIRACRLTGRSFPIWLLLMVAPAYCLARPSGFCSGEQVSSILARVFPADRIESLNYRLSMEDFLIRAALQNPILGWTRSGAFNPVDEKGNAAAVADGYWIIVFCWMGSVGLVLLNAMMLVPSALFLRRYAVRTWMTPQVAPLLGLATILPLCMIDNLSNAMLNPIYAIAMGLVTGCSTGRSRIDATGTPGEDGPDAAEALAGAIERQARVVRARPYGRNVERLASLRARYARSLSDQGRADLALLQRSAAEDLWSSIESSSTEAPWDPERAANANDLAWLLASVPGADLDRLAQARRLVEGALAGAPACAPFWNTLGIVCYRQGEYHRAIHALSRSVTLGTDGGTAFDFYFLTLANRALGYQQAASTWYARGEAWDRAHPEMGLALEAVRAEVLGGPVR